MGTTLAPAVLAKAPGSSAVTAAFTRHVKPGCVEKYDAWLHEMTGMASRWPGYQGVTVVRPPHGGVRPEYTTILRFDTDASLRAWLDAPERLALLERVAHIADEPADEVVAEPGMDFWFTPHHATPLTRPPPRWKMAIILTVSIFVLFNIIRQLIAPFSPYLPRLLLQLVATAVQVCVLTYFLMPWLTRRLAFWLQPGPR